MSLLRGLCCAKLYGVAACNGGLGWCCGGDFRLGLAISGCGGVCEVTVGGCYRLVDIPMSNCINSGINKIFVLTQFNSVSLNHHLSRTYFGNGVNFSDGLMEVLEATQTPGDAGMKWFQGTAVGCPSCL